MLFPATRLVQDGSVWVVIRDHDGARHHSILATKEKNGWRSDGETSLWSGCMRSDVSRPPVIVRNGASRSITIAGIVTSTVSKVTLPGRCGRVAWSCWNERRVLTFGYWTKAPRVRACQEVSGRIDRRLLIDNTCCCAPYLQVENYGRDEDYLYITMNVSLCRPVARASRWVLKRREYWERLSNT